MRRRREALIGAICPTCRTVQNWTGDGVFAASIVCRGDGHVGAHDRATVVAFGDPATALGRWLAAQECTA